MDKIKNLFNKSINFVKSNKLVTGVILIIIIIIFVVYNTFSKDMNEDYETDKKEDKEIKTENNYLFFQNEHPSNIPYRIDSKKLDKPVNEAMSLSFFIKVNNWYFNFDSWKHILHKGTFLEHDSNKKFNHLKFQSPGLWFHPKINNLRFVLSVYNNFEFKHKYCDIPNIPIGKYFHIVFTVENNTLSIFINKRLVKTCIFEGIPILTEGDVYINHGTTFDGFMKNLQFYDKVVSIDEIAELYSQK